jgi:NAD(P)-dependent dehydrogenase (short-subunit alcohol dehydrogenase family)
MELSDRICVVTGAASGIGRALCVRFAEEGAAAVVAVDIDEAGAAQTAELVEAVGGTRAVSLQADVSDEADIRAVVDRTEDEVGPIDLYASNAGILSHQGLEAPDKLWQKVWGINVMGHVYGAQAVIPRMVERGGGYLLNTASAAGLLTQPGDAAYSVTKHAAVGLAEWLSITYGGKGIKVSCLCPMAVDTAMLVPPDASGAAGAGPAPERPTGPGGAAAVEGIVTPEHVAEVAVEGIREERFLLLPHPDVAKFEQRRSSDRDRWLAGMRRLSDALGLG